MLIEYEGTITKYHGHMANSVIKIHPPGVNSVWLQVPLSISISIYNAKGTL